MSRGLVGTVVALLALAGFVGSWIYRDAPTVPYLVFASIFATVVAMLLLVPFDELPEGGEGQ